MRNIMVRLLSVQLVLGILLSCVCVGHAADYVGFSRFLSAAGEEAGAPNGQDPEQALAWLLERGHITAPEVPQIRAGTITRAVVWRVFLHIHGAAGTEAMFPELTEEEDGLGPTYRMARAVAISVGVAAEGENPCGCMTQAEFSRFLAALHRADLSQFRFLSGELFVRTLTKAIGGEPDTMSEEAMVAFLQRERVLTDLEIPVLPEDLTWPVVWRCFFSALGLWAEASEYGIEPDSHLQGTSYQNARAVAILTGLWNGEDSCVTVPRESEFLSFVERLESGDVPSLPVFRNGFSEAVLQGVTVNRKNARACTAVRSSSRLLPEKYRRAFLEEGWTLDLSGRVPAGVAVSAATTGITDYRNRKIYLYDAGTETCLHEFGHAIAAITGISDAMETIWAREKGSASQTALGAYAREDAAEFFAQAFALYLCGDREALGRAAPDTFRLLDEALFGASGLVDRPLAEQIARGSAPSAGSPSR